MSSPPDFDITYYTSKESAFKTHIFATAMPENKSKTVKTIAFHLISFYNEERI